MAAVSLEQAIRERWAASDALVRLVPLASLMTGAAHGDPAMPYVVLTNRGQTSQARTTSGTTLGKAEVRLAVYATDLDEAKRIAVEMRKALDRASLSWQGAAALDVQWKGQDEQLAADGTWQVAVDLVALVEIPSGA
jgi:hypothetical protein